MYMFVISYYYHLYYIILLLLLLGALFLRLLSERYNYSLLMHLSLTIIQNV